MTRDRDFTEGRHSQLFPEFIDPPAQEDLIECVHVYVNRMGQWTARPHWTQIRNWDKGGSVDAEQGKLGLTPRAIIIQDGKAREGQLPPTPDPSHWWSQGLIHKIPWRDNKSGLSPLSIKLLFLLVFGHFQLVALILATDEIDYIK